LGIGDLKREDVKREDVRRESSISASTKLQCVQNGFGELVRGGIAAQVEGTAMAFSRVTVR
jgi:hypothetical protein